ncbi:YadA-like family protein, partial [Campylobacter sp. JMF_15 NE4]|uniref:YadA family autotransporter adhesin n=1 Tax=Campylobacter sp. JMF_15 NE4 TaxID=2983825 RepID=UPI0022E9B92B
NLADGDISDTSTDAINGSQLKKAAEGNRTKVTVDGGTEAGTKGAYTGGNLKLTHGGENNNTYDLKLANNLTIGEAGDGTPGKPGEDGQIKVIDKDGNDGVTIAAKDGNGTIGLNGKNGNDAVKADITLEKGEPGVKETNEKTRIVYTTEDGKKETIATLNDGLKFEGNYRDGTNDPIAKKLNEQVDIVGTHTAGKDKLTTGNIGVINNGEKLVVELAKDVNLTEAGSIYFGKDGAKISNDNGDIKVGDENGGPVKITNLADGDISDTSTDAINGSQLKKAAEGNRTKVTVNGGTKAPDDGSYTDGNLKLAASDNNTTYDLKLANKLSLGDSAESGAVTVNNKNGKAGVEIFADDNTGEGHIKITNGKDGNDAVSADITVAKVNPADAGQNGTTNTRITYKDASGNPETVATLNDGLKFKGDKGDVVSKKLNETLNIKGNTTVNAKLTEGNIGVENVGGDLIIKLAQNIDLGKDGSVKAGDTTINNDGLTIAGGPTITKTNVDMGGNRIQNVAEGTDLTDAVNLSQLKAVEGKIKAPNTVSSKNGSVKIAETTNTDGSKNYDLKVATKQNSDGTVSMVTYNADGSEKTGPVQVKNVAAGKAPTDAVNVSQLKELVGNYTVENYTDENGNTFNNVVQTKDEKGKTVTLKTYNVKDKGEYVTNNVVTAISKMNEQGIKFFHTNEDENFKPEEQRKNTVDSSASGGHATAIGYQADASGKSSLAVGDNANASGEQSIAIGNGAQASGKQSISVGTGNLVYANNAGAFGDPNTVAAGADGSYVIGNNNNVSTNDTFVMGNDVTSTVADSLFLGSRTAYVGEGTRSKGTNNAYTSDSVTAKNAAGENVVIGMKNFAGGDQVKGVVSVGNANETRRIQNVAPGLISKDSTDAINGSQLYSAIEGIAEHLGSNITNINQRIDNLDKKIDNVRDEARAGVASAIAIGNLPQSTIPGKGMLSVGTGYYQDEGALSIGLSKMSDNGKWVFKSSISVDTQDNIGAGASLGFHF